MSLKNKDVIKFKNYQLRYLVDWLDVPMHGQEARNRNKFLTNILRPHIKSLEERRLEIGRGYAETDEEGEPIEENGSYSISEEDQASAWEDYQDLLDEEISIQITEDNIGTLASIRDTLYATTREFNIQEGRIYDEVCDAFE